MYTLNQFNWRNVEVTKDVMQRKLFQKCTHLLYCSVLSLGGNVNTRRMLPPDIGSIFHIKKSMKYSGHMKLLFELSKLSNLMLLTSSDTKRTLMHLFLFTNTAQRELVSICRRVYATTINLHYTLGGYCIVSILALEPRFAWKQSFPYYCQPYQLTIFKLK